MTTPAMCYVLVIYWETVIWESIIFLITNSQITSGTNSQLNSGICFLVPLYETVRSQDIANI